MILAEDAQFLVASDLQPAIQFVQNGLNDKLKGKSNHYNHIVAQVLKRDDPDMLWRLLLALCTNVSLLTQNHENFRDLVQTLYSYDWKSEAKVTVALLNLMGSLVSYNATFLAPTIQFLCKGFLVSNLNTIDRNTHSARIHCLIRHLLLLAPTGQSELFPVLSQTYPHKRFDVDTLQSYVNELFSVTHYLPGIQENILDLIITKCIEIDVDIVVEDSGDVKINESDTFENSDAQEMSNMFSFDETGKLQGFRLTNDSQKLSDEVCAMAEKLDVLLISLIQYLDSEFSFGKLEINISLFRSLLNIFEERVLPTHRSKFCQFIFFYIAGRTHYHHEQKFSELFSLRLLRIFTQPSFPSIKRQCSVLYFASFISRSNFFNIKFVG